MKGKLELLDFISKCVCLSFDLFFFPFEHREELWADWASNDRWIDLTLFFSFFPPGVPSMLLLAFLLSECLAGSLIQYTPNQANWSTFYSTVTTGHDPNSIPWISQVRLL